MKASGIFVAYIATLFLAGAALEYPVYRLANLFTDTSYYTFSGRLVLPLAALTLYFFLRARKLSNAQALGYALPWQAFIRFVVTGFGAGILIMIPLLALMLGLEIRVPAGDLQRILTAAGPAFFDGLVSGILVGLIEETFFRGAMYTEVERESRIWWAILLTSALYAVVHFVDTKYRIPVEELNWWSGFVILGHSFDTFTQPSRIIDSLLALFAVGIFLACSRASSGHIAYCIGLHAGWVTAIRVAHRTSHENPDSAWSWMIGSFDGIIGYLAFAWLILLAIVIFNPLLQQRGGDTSSAKQKNG